MGDGYTFGARCANCGGTFVVHGSAEDRARARCQCSPDAPLEMCSACVDEDSEHASWCSVVTDGT
jgi:nitroimidazol reductase NimA-like FMN-containing flavoprotein (pyridoxamine 5'-phosphate oxidase superfamily)